MKPKKVSEITKTIAQTFVSPKAEGPDAKPEKQLKPVAFTDLKGGKNLDVVVSCKILSMIDKSMSVPLYKDHAITFNNRSFLIIDGKGNCCCLSLYNTSKEACEDIKPRTDCFITEPFLSSHDLVSDGKLLAYQCIKVTDLRNIYVNGKPLTAKFSKSEIVSKTIT